MFEWDSINSITSEGDRKDVLEEKVFSSSTQKGKIATVDHQLQRLVSRKLKTNRIDETIERKYSLAYPKECEEK